MKPSELDWDLLRVFLAVMRTTSLRDAAAALDVSHPTVRRRLAELEQTLGLSLFERRSEGLRATPEATELLRRAEDVEASVHALRRRASAVDSTLSGPVRLSAPDVVVSHLLMPALVAFSARWPEIRLDLQATEQVADLAARQADVAIRAMPLGVSPKGELVGRKAATVCTAVYGRDHQWIGWFGDERDAARIGTHPFPGRPTIAVMPNMVLQHAACTQGLGLAVLPCFLAEPGLERRTEPKPSRDLWVLVHPDLRRTERFRVLRDQIVAALDALKPRLEGTV
ncbi:MAG: LysR family transcriptional regulator [Myxococcota bacterium]